MSSKDRMTTRMLLLQRWFRRVVSNRLCRFPILVLVAGYFLFLLPRTVGPFNDDYLSLTTPAAVLAAVGYVAFHIKEIRKDRDLVLFYGWFFAVMFPLARESTHYDPIQVPCAIVTSSAAIAFFIAAFILWLRTWRRKNIEYHI